MDATRGRLNSTNGPVEDIGAGPTDGSYDMNVPARRVARVNGASVAADSTSDATTSQLVCGGRASDVDMLIEEPRRGLGDDRFQPGDAVLPDDNAEDLLLGNDPDASFNDETKGPVCHRKRPRP